MSGETEQNVSGWTVDTLRAHLERVLQEHDRRFLASMHEKDLRDQQRFDAQEKAVGDALAGQEKSVTAALNAAERAVLKAETAAEKRFESINEFRGQLGDQAATLMPRQEATVLLDALGGRVFALESRMNKATGHGTGVEDARALLLGVLVLLVAAVGVIVAFAK